VAALVEYAEDVDAAERAFEIAMWDVGPAPEFRRTPQMNEWFSDVAMSPDGTMVVALSSRKLMIWDLQRDLRAELRMTRIVGEEIHFSADGREVVVVDTGHYKQSVLLTVVPSGASQQYLRERLRVDCYQRFAFSPDGGTFAALTAEGDGRTVSVHRRDNGQLLSCISSIGRDIDAVAYSPDGKYIYFGGNDGIVWSWNVTEEQREYVGQGPSYPVRAVSFCPTDEAVVAFGGGECMGIPKVRGAVWDVLADAAVRELEDYRAITHIAYSADGKRLAVTDDFQTRYQHPKEPAARIRIYEDERELILASHRDEVNGIAFSPDGSRLASICDQSLRIWDASNGSRIAQHLFRNDNLGKGMGVAWLPDGTALVVGFSEAIVVLEAKRLKQQSIFARQQGILRGMKLSPNGQLLIGSPYDVSNDICLWDIPGGRLAHTIAGYERAHALAISPDGGMFVSGHGDGFIRLWKLPLATLLKEFRLERGVALCVAFSANGKWLAAGGTEARVLIWPIEELLQRSAEACEPGRGS